MIESFPRFAEDLDEAVRAERDGLVKLLREAADRIERAPVERVGESLAWIAAAVTPLIRTTDRVWGRPKS